MGVEVRHFLIHNFFLKSPAGLSNYKLLQLFCVFLQYKSKVLSLNKTLYMSVKMEDSSAYEENEDGSLFFFDAKLSAFQEVLDRIHSVSLSIDSKLETLLKLLGNDFKNLKSQMAQNEGHKSAQEHHLVTATQSMSNAGGKPQYLMESDIPCINGLDEVAGLGDVKKELYTLVILPRNQPQLFVNRKICNSLLLYGPPGTGKTRLVHGLAAECGAVLHTVSVAGLLSPYVGETEKNMKQIFNYLSTTNNFSILFLDEIDGLCQMRTSSEPQHTRRIKTELMTQMTKMSLHQHVVIIGATNCPWDLDSAVMRRFQRRIYVPLPDLKARLELFQYLTKDIHIAQTSDEFQELITICDGFSGSDIAGLVQDAWNIPLMELHATNIWKKTVDGFYEPIVLGANPTNLSDMNDIYIEKLQTLPPFTVRARQVSAADFIKAAKRVQVTVKQKDLKNFEQFQQEK